MKAVDVGKTVSIHAGKNLVDKAGKRLTTPTLQVASVMVPQKKYKKNKRSYSQIYRYKCN